MNRAPVLAVLFALAMTAASLIAPMLKPENRYAQSHPIGSLDLLIPQYFGGWRSDASFDSYVVNPVISKELAGLYSQVLSRAYINKSGYRIMLSIAYGDDQTREMQVHRPEVCYTAQGFQLSKTTMTVVQSRYRDIPVLQLMAVSQQRTEPLTYWVRIGGKLVRGNSEQGLARISYGLRGYVADGLLVRVSSVDPDDARAHAIQAEFIRALIDSLPPEKRRVLVGTA